MEKFAVSTFTDMKTAAEGGLNVQVKKVNIKWYVDKDLSLYIYFKFISMSPTIMVYAYSCNSESTKISLSLSLSLSLYIYMSCCSGPSFFSRIWFKSLSIIPYISIYI